ncbi:unnamed protein product, partial [Rotaria magnacalcarata]
MFNIPEPVPTPESVPSIPEPVRTIPGIARNCTEFRPIPELD